MGESLSNPNPNLFTAQAEVNETTTVELDRVTCMTAGEDIFRTFDDARFTYYSTCTIALLKSTNGLEVYTQTVCEADNKCNCRKFEYSLIILASDFSSLFCLRKTCTVKKLKKGVNVRVYAANQDFYWILIC